MMIHDFDLARYYIGSDKFKFLFATGEHFSGKKYKNINDLELATVVMKSKKVFNVLSLILDIAALATIKELSCLVIKAW